MAVKEISSNLLVKPLLVKTRSQKKKNIYFKVSKNPFQNRFRVIEPICRALPQTLGRGALPPTTLANPSRSWIHEEHGWNA